MGHPPRLMTVGLLACCLLLLIQPSYTSRCIVGCHGMHSDQSYKEGETYTYALEGTSVSSVSEGQGEATLNLKADVELAVKPDCIRQLRLKNVQVNGAAVPQQDLEKYALQFNYHHGHIDTELCAEPGDSQASLNIKRAVISLFQSSVVQEEGSTTRHEFDILGGCVTDFTFYKDGDVQIVNKIRNLNSCSHRENIKQGLFSGIVNPVAGIQSTPIIGAQQKVEQRFTNGVLQKAVSSETYKLRPFSNGDAGAKTVVSTTLTFKGQKADSTTAAVSLPKSLIFEAPHPIVKSSVENIEKALQPIHKDDTEAVKPETARRFSELIRVLRTSSKKDILTVYHRIKAGANYDPVKDKKVLLDALYRTGTGEAAEVVVELIKNKEITDLQALLYYASLAFIQHVNLPSVTAITTLLDQPNLSRIGYLGIGQIIGKYCQQHSCENVPEVKGALEKIVAKVKDGKANTRAEENIIIAALKGLGNARYLDDGTLQKLANIAADKKVRNRVRVAAIEALPTKCSTVWANILSKTFADQEEDSEIRNKIYLSYVACPSSQVASIVKNVLDKENINQVGSFITSHLRNLRASADPFKQDAKAHFGQIRPRTKFPEDFRKFSFNNELSYNLDAFGVGSATESNVIFSQNSFVPRSASLNLTTEIFGHSFNFLELNTRAENLDRVIEHLFGPKGVVLNQKPQETVKDGFSNVKSISKYIKERFEKSTRSKRDVKQADLDKFSKAVQLRNNEVDEDLDLDLSIKLFGVELAFLSYEGTSQAYTPQQIVDKIFEYFDQGVKKFKNLEYDVENHVHFLDAEFVYPTGLGVALNLGITGSSVVRTKTNTKVDIPAILADPANAALKIALEPSASIEFVGDINVADGFGTESGIRLITTLHTATGYDLNVKILGGKGVHVDLAVPKRKQEIVSISSDVLYSNGKPDKYTPIKFGKGKERSDCFDQFTAPLGLTVCGHISYPYDNLASLQKKPLYPLSGPFKFYVTIENNDVSKYHFKALYDDKNPKDRSLEILFETPNSRTNRYVKLVVQAATEPDAKLKFSLDSPIKKASAEALVKRNDKEQTLTVTVRNDQVEYFARAGVESVGANKYKPVLEYKVPEHIEKLASGKGGNKAVSKGGQSHQILGTVEAADHDGGKKYVFNDVQFVSNGRKIIGIDGTASSTPKALDIDINLGYAEDKLTIKVDGKRLAELHYTLYAAAIPSRNPANSFAINWEYNRQKTKLNHLFEFVQGADLKSKTERLRLVQNAEFNPDPEQFILSTKNELTYPKVGLEAKLEGALTKKSVKAEAKLKYDKFKCGTELSGKINQNKPGDYEIEFDAEAFDNKIELESKRTIIDDTKSKFENSLKLSPGGTYKADSTVKWQVKKNDVDLDVDADINLNNKKLKFDTGLQCTSEKLNNHVQVLVNDVKYIDYNLKISRGQNPNGNLVLNLKNYLTANGKFAYQNGKGSGNLDIDIPKINRKIKGSGDVSVSGTKHVANLELAYDAEKDPNKKSSYLQLLILQRIPLIRKNVIEILTYKTEFNLKGKYTGDLFNGEQGVNFDLLLPNGLYFTTRANRVCARKDDKIDVSGNSEFAVYTKKGAAEGKKLSFDLVSKVLSINNLLIDSNLLIKYVHDNGKDITYRILTKNLAQTNVDKKSASVDITASGTLIPYVVSLNAAANYDSDNVAFKGAYSRGSDFVISSNVNFGSGNYIDKPHTLKGSIEAKLPSDKLQNIRVDFDESLLIQKEDNGIVEYIKDKTVTYNNDKTIKHKAHYKQSGKKNLEDLGKFDRVFSATLKVLDKPALVINENYNHDLTGDVKKVQGKGSIQYGDKSVTGDVDIKYQSDKASLTGKFTTPFEKLKNIDVKVDHKRENERSRKTDVVLTVDGVKYTQTSEIELDENSPGIRLAFTCPAGTTELLSKFKKLGENEYLGEYKLSTPKGFVAADGRVKLESVDDFVINVNFDSDKIKYRKLHAEITNKPSSQDGRRIFVTVTSEGKNIVTGSTNYQSHHEDKKVTLEGSGSLKIGENTKGSSFKYVRKQLTREADKEVGVAIKFNASFGPSAIVGELKLTDKEVNIFNSYCEQSKDCAQFKLQSILDTDHISHVNHQLQVEVNLKKFNVPVEFGLQSSTKYADYVLDHTANLYLHSSKDRTQYTYHLYSNKHESAIVLSLPSRELAVVAFHDVPAVKHSGAYKIDLSLYLDRKNKPSEKTSIVLAGNIAVEKDAVGINGEARFTYPSQPKDMLIKGKVHVGGEQLLDGTVDIDVFNSKNDKITANAKLVRTAVSKGYNVTGNFNVLSKGQKLDVKSDQHFALITNSVDLGASLSYTDIHQKPKSLGAYFTASPEQVDLLVYVPDKELINSRTTINVAKDSQNAQTELSVLGHKPISANLELKDYNSFKVEYGRKGDSKNKLVANGKVVLGQLAEIHADAFKDGAKQELFHLLIHLDEGKFMKPDFAYNNKHIVGVINHVRERLLESAKEGQQVGEEIAKEAVTEFTDLFEHLKKAQPSLKTLIAYFQSELAKLKDELHADETIKEIQDVLNKTFGGIIAAITETIKNTVVQLEDLRQQLNEIIEKLREAGKQIYPQLRDSFIRLRQVALAIADSFAKLALAYIEAFIKVWSEHQKDIEELVSVAAELVQDIAKIILKGVSQIEKEVKEFVQLFVQQIHALPVYEMAQNAYKELVNYKVPDYIISPIQEFCLNIKNLLPTQELRDLFSTVYNYVIKHIKHQKVDDSSEVRKIYSQTLNAIRSIITLLQSHVTVENVFNFFETQFPVDVSYLRKLPGIAAIRFSIVKLLASRELPTIADIYLTYRPNHNAEDIIPPAKKYGYFADGGYFITFDGRQFVFPGTCNYILAQDMQDGNFSVVGEYTNGNLVSVSLTAPGESITVKSNGNVLVNNKPADYPASTKNIDAYLSVPLRRIKSKYGVKVVCTIGKSMSCYARVSGFYHGKVRGLLGDANNEVYDDFIQPNGKIAATATDFGNAYKLNPSCAPAAAKESGAPRSPICTKYFSGKSPLSSCFSYVDPKEFRVSCDQQASAKNGPCIVAAAYMTACYIQNIPVSLPNECVKCKVGDDVINGGESFSVNTPKKQADIIFVVEQEADNEKAFKDFVKPMINELRTELKQQGITDVFIGLIGFGEGLKWPRHYTSNSNVNIEGGDINHMAFSNVHDPIVSLEEAKEDKQGNKKLQFLKQRLDVELGTFKVTDAYEAAVRYPFRAGASKAVVGVISLPCEKSPLSPFSFQDYRLLLGRHVYNQMGLTYYHVSPLKDLEVSGKAQKNVVGYDKDYVYTFADSKKKPLEGNADLKSNLVTGTDVCARFAVNTGGAAFSSHNFLEAKPNQQAQYVKVAARRIAENLASIEIKQDCVCTAEAGYGNTVLVVSRPHCKIVSHNDKRHKPKA